MQSTEFSGPSELELHMAMSHPLWELETELSSSAREVCTLDCSAISSAPGSTSATSEQVYRSASKPWTHGLLGKDNWKYQLEKVVKVHIWLLRFLQQFPDNFEDISRGILC